MKTMLLFALALLLGGCTCEGPKKGYCKEQAFSLSMGSTNRECDYPGSWIEKVGNEFVCRCPKLPGQTSSSPAPSASAE